ncbi:hypothetical protein A9P82_11820 [Arachidicoccus ginsenosidimutans]|uniref:hypothetical protein n=1 Tax=Arachidicoccus sp. BS20 TaxID=1850526 RepID=UPI0007F1805F|nr:hypothetical protein [Arachidicoccus sp. BS20]ANI89913.1 hypothetical protein A9P82_11820 [Arachidicoccus sp. BS20]
MIKKIFIIVFGVATFFCARAQTDSALWQKDFGKVKTTMLSQPGQNATLYSQLSVQLDSLAIKNPGNAEAWYFLGSAIDKFNTSSGEEIPSSSLSLAEKSSACFSNALDLSNGKYEGQTLLFDPHTKILSVWGAQAFRYIDEGKKDSAIWCLLQANETGGINQTVKNYFKQVLDECSDSSYLFTNGDLYFYYLAYLQLVEHYRADVHCVSLNFLNTQWYPQMLNASGFLPLGISNDSLAKIQNIEWKAQDVVLQNKDTALHGDSLISWNLKSTNGNYILRSDLILKLFVQQNAFRKNIFFAADVPENMRLFLSTRNYAELRGLTLKIVPRKNLTSLSFLENRLAELNELTADDSAFTCNKDNIQVLNNYRFAYTAAADLAMLRNEADAAQNILAFEEKKYPETLLPFYADATKKWFNGFRQKILDTALNK